MLTRYEVFSSVISTIHRGIQKIERDEMIKYGYKGSFAQYLTAMTRYPEGVTAAQLCEICDRDKAAVSRAIAEMEEKKLIRRDAFHDNAYRARLVLTEEGKQAAAFVFNRARAAVDAVGKDLTDGDRAVFYAVLEKISVNLDALSKDGLPL